MLIIFSTQELNRYLWKLKTAVFLHWGLKCAVPLAKYKSTSIKILRFARTATSSKYRQKGAYSFGLAILGNKGVQTRIRNGQKNLFLIKHNCFV